MLKFLRDKAHHSAIEQWTAQQQFSPGIAFVDAQQGYLVSDYIEPEIIPSEAYVNGLAKLLTQLHSLPTSSLPVEGEIFSAVQHSQSLLAQLKQHEQYQRLLSLHHPLLEQLKAFDEHAENKPVISHNDLHPGNYLFDGKNAYLIDWEYCQLNHPAFDLASLVIYFDLERESLRKLSRQYSSDKGWQTALQSAGVAVKWLDSLWRMRHLNLNIEQLPYFPKA